MKIFIAVILAGFTLIASATSDTFVEFDRDAEVKCASEFKKLGCTQKTDKTLLTCVETKKEQLTKDCRFLHDTKVNN